MDQTWDQTMHEDHTRITKHGVSGTAVEPAHR